MIADRAPAANEREKDKKSLLAIASERRAAARGVQLPRS
jgi:hypothetical protein